LRRSRRQEGCVTLQRFWVLTGLDPNRLAA
jgi:hypothetical protein